MKQNFKKLVAGAALVLGAFGAIAADPIKIGSVLSVTGPAAFLGDPELKTLQLYVDDINKKGGVLGRPLQLVHYDDGSDANKANGFAKRLLEDDKVDVLVGGTTTGSTMSMVPLAEKSATPFISLAGAVVIVEPVKKFVFKTPHTDRMAAEKVFEDMKKRGLTKVALLSETSGFGASGKKETEGVAAKYGITLVANETYGPKDTDMSPQLTKIKTTPGLQAVFVFGLGQGPAIVTKNYKQLGVTLPLYQSHGVASDEFLKLAGPAAEGVRLPSPAQLIPEKLAANDPQKPIVTAYDKAYKAAYKTDVSTFGGYAYDGLMLAVDAIKRAGSTDKAKVRDALEATKGFVATSGTFNMSPTDHMGLDLSAFRLLEVKGGDWVIVQ
ncbi:ABC transporter substrate-binding protein [Ferribacterium limneticum]|uniref:ABC transporter substrate-binding protein n=1 Tax=Ferribacterium limneticum TaxID=76259 RepID=UPI001CFAD585|nr:ABC transporter substrate-binding protein [Ferribacterium limneticum]UCV28902.1 ABC transporter substrate-binding protein [Ferribacterium limneticum]UCV32820.1 ABC transporter substrate-binding protein [Ferribacterium limneticum]